jgi:hypothetical protein
MEQRARQTDARATRDWAQGDGAAELVFTTNSGLPIEPRNFVRSFQRACRRDEMRLIRVHDIRHTTATLLKSLGVPDRDIQLILGHSRISVTQETYEHDDMASRAAALGRAEAVLVGPANDSVGRGNGRQVALDSRQNEPSTVWSARQFSSEISGGATGTRTLDLFHAIPINVSPVSRATQIKLASQRCTRIVLLGVVAVSTSRQISPRRHISQSVRVTAKAASSLHERPVSSSRYIVEVDRTALQ